MYNAWLLLYIFASWLSFPLCKQSDFGSLLVYFCFMVQGRVYLLEEYNEQLIAICWVVIFFVACKQAVVA
jgi:hypothetical protein